MCNGAVQSVGRCVATSSETVQHACLDAVLDFAAPEDGLFGEGAIVGQRVDVDAEKVLPLQHAIALRACRAPLLRQQ